MSDDTTDYAREGIEHARHAQALGDQWARHVAVLIAALAAALALAQIGENAAQDGAISYQVAVSDDWALNQAKDVRASIRAVEASVLESLPNPPDASAGAAIQATAMPANKTGFCNGPPRVNPSRASCRRYLASVRGQRGAAT
jgi:hypothetical protein